MNVTHVLWRILIIYNDQFKRVEESELVNVGVQID